MIDPKTFKMDSDWDNAGFEFVNWSREYERVYVISNGDMTLLMSDTGNGHCRFVGVVSTSLENNAPIYKVITLSIRNGSCLSHEMFGWYHHLGAAALAVEQNALDMQDHAFNYALVSCSYQGGYGLSDEEIQWYEWNYTDGKWFKCERPEACNSLRFV